MFGAKTRASVMRAQHYIVIDTSRDVFGTRRCLIIVGHGNATNLTCLSFIGLDALDQYAACERNV